MTSEALKSGPARAANQRPASGPALNQFRPKFGPRGGRAQAGSAGPRATPDSDSAAPSPDGESPDQLERRSTSPDAPDRQQQQHHAGPVMGIFFKVWSLVKVTRGRHQQKLRRQNSADTSQFHFISGEQLASTSGLGAPPAARPGPFRRAGSQPAAGSGRSPGPAASHWLQVSAQQQLQGSGPVATTPTSTSVGGTASGSSSGVSSITSSTLATATAAAGAELVPAGSPTRPELNGAALVPPATKQRREQPRGTWASRIRGSANGRPVGGLAALSAAPAGQPTARQLRAKSEQTNPPPDELHRRWMRAHLGARESISDDDDGVDHDDEVEAAAAERAEPSHKGSLPAAANDDDSDFNDIYSTPNDSIQSVPSTAPMMTPGAAGQCSQQPGGRRQSAFAYPIKKSFSTTSVSQLQQPISETVGGGGGSCGPIDEQQEQSCNQNGPVADRLHPPASFQPPSGAFQDRLSPDGERAAAGKRLAAGSRFFISSSSSEESNPPGGQQQRRAPQAANTAGLHQEARGPLQVHFGLHHHQPAAPNRPESLLLEPGDAVHLRGAPLFTPAAGSPAALVAAVSPAGAHYWLPASLVAPSGSGYKKSPSLFEMSSGLSGPPTAPATRFSSRLPLQDTRLLGNRLAGRTKLVDEKLGLQQAYFLSSFKPSLAGQQLARASGAGHARRRPGQVPNSVSLQDCKLSSAASNGAPSAAGRKLDQAERENSPPTGEAMPEYKLARMLLESGSNPSARDQSGSTALMHAVLSENPAALKCLVEHGVDLNAVNKQGLSALDLACSRPPSEIRVEMLKLLIGNQADLDRARESDGTRLLDRLIAEHQPGSPTRDKLPYIDCLLHNGAKLGSSTWLAASGKHEIQLRLLRKLCQDGYFLYKKCSIEPAVYRFEYALKRIAELEKQLDSLGRCRHSQVQPSLLDETMKAVQQVKYQTYLGLSRCERKRRFFKRALEFAHMSILVNSTSYEGYYSKANILKDLGEFNEALSAIKQTSRLVDNIIETIGAQLTELQHHEESIVFDGCFDMHNPGGSGMIEANRAELLDNLEYLEEAKKHIARLQSEILEDKESATLAGA